MKISLNKQDVELCADLFKGSFINTFYLIITYSKKAYIFVGEEGNFPHLIGIPVKEYRDKYHYKKASDVLNDLINRRPLKGNMLAGKIPERSKKYKKILNFQHSPELFWRTNGLPMLVHFDKRLQESQLQVDELLLDIETGYMLGWVKNRNVSINENISLEKYCICSWIDESGSDSDSQKEKYLHNQNVTLVHSVFAFDQNSKLSAVKEYTYTREQKKRILQACERNNANLCLDSNNESVYREIALRENIHCTINGIKQTNIP